MKNIGEFNAIQYWRQRLSKNPDLRGTGTSYAPIDWQYWLYQGKERAYLRLLKRSGIDVRRLYILNFGCGTGYFEDFWEKLGAFRADGLDIVPDLIEKLKLKYPYRKYHCADISRDRLVIKDFDSPQLITAIDVLYHIVDDNILSKTIDALASIISDNGYFLFTDSCNISKTAGIHVHFRTIKEWNDILKRVGLFFISKEPVFAVNNNVLRGIGRVPYIMGATQHYLDYIFLKLFPWMANNWVFLAKKY